MRIVKAFQGLVTSVIAYLTVPTADATTNAYSRDVVGNKSDAAQTTVGTTRSIIAYVKGILNQIVTVLANQAVPTADVATNALSSQVVGNKTDAAVQAATTDKSVMAYAKGLLTATGNPTGDTLATITAKLGNSATAIAPQVALATGNEYAGTYSLPNDTNENTAFDFDTSFATLAGKRIKNITVFLDATNLVQSVTVRFKVKVDGTNLRTIDSMVWTTSDNVGLFFDLASCNIDFAITIQSAVAQGAAKDVPIRCVFEQSEV